MNPPIAAKHLLFFDGTCGLCDRVVQYVIKHDKKKLFCFAPLQGTTAQQLLKDLPLEMKNIDSLILFENFQQTSKRVHIQSQGALRLCWLVGGWLSLFGLLSFLPSKLFNGIYALVAKNRHRFFKQCLLHHDHQFLP